MNLKERIDRCIKQWPEEIEVAPHFRERWRDGLFIVPSLHEVHDNIEQATVGVADEVPDRQIHTAILMVLKDAAISFNVLHPRELQHREVARVLHGYLADASFDPELGYTDQDRSIAKQVADAAASMILI